MAADGKQGKLHRWLEMFGQHTEDDPMYVEGWNPGDAQPDGWESGFRPSEKLLEVRRGLQRMHGVWEHEDIEELGIQIKTAYGDQVYPADWLRHLPLIVHFAGEEFNEQRRMTVMLIATVQELQMKVESLEADNATLARILKNQSR